MKLLLFPVFSLLFAAPAFGIDYKTDVLPIMKTHCWKCHSNEHEVKGSLALDDLDEMRESQISKFNIIRPGDPAESSFLEKMRLPTGDSDFMPRKGDPLPEKEIAIIEKWIAEGAIVDSKKLGEKEIAYLTKNGKPVDEKAKAPSPDTTFYQWTNTEGKTIEARFMGLTEDAVKILLKSGQSHNYPLSKLSRKSTAQAKKLGEKK